MWRTTGDSKWRDRGWAVFEAIEKHAKVGNAYASIKDVNRVPVIHEDELPRYVLRTVADTQLTTCSSYSFFFAETCVQIILAVCHQHTHTDSHSHNSRRLKYAFLLATDEELVPLDKWVFNTEAHPFPNFLWSEWEKNAFNIKV